MYKNSMIHEAPTAVGSQYNRVSKKSHRVDNKFLMCKHSTGGLVHILISVVTQTNLLRHPMHEAPVHTLLWHTVHIHAAPNSRSAGSYTSDVFKVQEAC